MPSAVCREGELRMVPPLDPAERRRERFPDPVGEIDLDTTLHSEVATLPDHFRPRGIREVTFRQGFESAFSDRLRLLVQLGLVDTTPLPGFDRPPRDVLKALLDRLPPPVPAGPSDRYEILRVRVIGTVGDGTRAEVVMDCHAGAQRRQRHRPRHRHRRPPLHRRPAPGRRAPGPSGRVRPGGGGALGSLPPRAAAPRDGVFFALSAASIVAPIAIEADDVRPPSTTTAPRGHRSVSSGSRGCPWQRAAIRSA